MLVMALDDRACQAVAAAGGKAANLSRLAARHPVPSGFCLTTAAFRRWAESGKAARVPEDVRAPMTVAYQALSHRSGTGSPRVAVRSSAIAEDGDSASFAGQYATYLNVSGLPAVEEAVLRCWAAGAADRVQAYRRRHGDCSEEDSVAVLVQELILADVAFIAFSANPVTGDREEIVINSNWGLGESIVDSQVVPDTYVLRKSDGTLIEAVIAEKARMTIVGPDGVRSVGVPRALRRRGTLTPANISAVASLVRQLEIEMGWPVDIEGAFRDQQIYLLQCRPITAR